MSGRSAIAPDVLALAFEVDYWDRLGWKDTFSKPAWTARQYAYAQALGARRRLHAAGGRQRPGRGRRPGAGRAGRADEPRRSRRGRPERRLFAADAVTVGRGAAPAGGADVWLARYIPHTVEVTIPRGENAGHTLPVQGRGARDGPLRQMARRSGDVPRCPAAIPASRRRRSCRRAGQGRSSRRRKGNERADC